MAQTPQEKAIHAKTKSKSKNKIDSSVITMWESGSWWDKWRTIRGTVNSDSYAVEGVIQKSGSQTMMDKLLDKEAEKYNPSKSYYSDYKWQELPYPVQRKLVNYFTKKYRQDLKKHKEENIGGKL